MTGWIRLANTEVANRLERLDPGASRRIKGLRLVTAYAIAAMLGVMGDVARGMPDAVALSGLAGGFALWASVSEGRDSRAASSRDLLLLVAAAGLGAISFIVFAPVLGSLGTAWPELVLVSGAFAVGFLKRFGVTGAGIGSQIFIGQLLAYGADLTLQDLKTVVVAVVLAAIASIVPRVLSGPSEHPVAAAPAALAGGRLPELIMGLQAATAALIIVVLNAWIGLTESAWAITACAYVVAYTTSDTLHRVTRRAIGTAIGVPLALLVLALASDQPLILWPMAALAMVIYAMALPERYDIACGAYAFTLVVTLAAGGETSMWVLASRAWETLLGGAFGLAAALFLFPLRPSPRT